ncbi:MAG: DUF2339 domain-containing protein [Lachnospiraceae bacterium]|nr:DUF2339 domain-containing protein [Lachnospiraceae bacterium]
MNLEERVEILEKRVEYLEKQLQVRQTPISRENVDSAVIRVDNTFTERPVFITRPQNVPRQEPALNPAVNKSNARQPVQRVTNDMRMHNEKPKNKDMESFIGKNVFVVVASVLIFVGMVVFAAAVMPYLSREVKFAAMVLGSMLLSIAGYMLSRRKSTVFNVALLACGLGAVYITLFTGKIYFGFISDVPLYLSLLVWCVVVYLCSGYKSILFNIIGQAGILISLVMGSVNIVRWGGFRLTLFLAVYVIIAEILYNTLYKNENYLANSMSALVSLMILSALVNDFITSTEFDIEQSYTNIFAAPVLISVLFILLLYVLTRNLIYAKNGVISIISYTVTGYTAYLSLIITLIEITDSDNACAYITALFGVLMYIITEHIYIEEENLTLIIFSTVMSCVSVVCYCFAKHSYCSVLIIPCLIAVYRRFRNSESEVSRMPLYCSALCSAFFSTIYTITGEIINSWDLAVSGPAEAVYLITGIVFIIVICLISKPEKPFEKISLYMALAMGMFIQIPASPETRLLLSEISRILLCLCLMLATQIYIKLKKDFINKEEPLFSQAAFICFFIINALCMLYSLYALDKIGNGVFTYAAALAIAAALFSLNVFNLMKAENFKLSAYVGIKYTILIIFAAGKFENKPVTSILLFLWAIVCLVFGQKIRQKPLRLYALILALLSTVKLLVFDISYDNLVMRAFSLIICGGLCFGISLFYTRLEKSMKGQ